MKSARILTAIALSLLTLPALAGFPGEVPDRFQFTLGGMAMTLDTQAGAGTVNGGIGATIVFEDLFNIPVSDQTGFVSGWWRFTDRSYLDFGWLKIDRAGARVLSEDVTFRGYTFQAGTTVTGGIDSSFPYAAYRYDFLQLDQVKISGSAGISYIDLGAWLAADANVLDPDGNPIDGYRKAEISIGMPVPLVGFQLDWVVSKRNTIVISSRMIYANFSGLRAQITENPLHWYYHATKNFAFGAGIDRIAIGIPSYEKDDQFATFNYNLTGAAIYGKVCF